MIHNVVRLLVSAVCSVYWLKCAMEEFYKRNGLQFGIYTTMGFVNSINIVLSIYIAMLGRLIECL